MSQLSTIYISSKDRLNITNTTSSSFSINLKPYGLINATSFVIKSITIPYSFYTTSYKNLNGVHPGNQYFTLRESIGLQTIDIQIPFGNYSYIDMVNSIGTQLNDPTNTLLFKPYNVSYNTATNKFTITSSSAFSFDLLFSTEFAGQPNYKKISTIMGFTPIDHTSSTGGLSTITSDFTSNLSGTMNIYIKSDTLTYQNSNFFNNNVDTAICGIPLIQAPNSIIYWEDQQLLQQRMRASLANVMNFTLVDEYNNELDLNGLDWSIIICFYSDVI